jgi:hypothetical protein
MSFMQNLLKKPGTTSSTIIVPSTPKPVATKPFFPKGEPSPTSSPDKKTVRKRHAQSTPGPHIPEHVHLFLLAVIGYSGIAFILLRIQPSSIQHIFLPNSYSPLLFLFFVSTFFLSSFLLNNTRRGLLISFVLTLYLFLRLQQLLTFPLGVGIAIPFLLYELLMTFALYKRIPHSRP